MNRTLHYSAGTPDDALSWSPARKRRVRTRLRLIDMMKTTCKNAVRNAILGSRLLLLAASISGQQDLRVPSGYPDIQAAINAANPGDRILLEGGASPLPSQFGDLVIDKSVTIESDSPGAQALIMMSAASGLNAGGRIIASSLTPGIPLVLRDLYVVFQDVMVIGSAQMGMVITSQGEVRMEGVTMLISPYAVDPVTVATISATRVWLRQCSFLGLSIGPNNPCFDPTFWSKGGDALAVSANTLVMEECDCTGGDAAYLQYYGSCDPPQEYGNGGTALRATTTASILTRCRFQDGNASWFQPGPWSSVPATQAGASAFTNQGGTLLAWDVLHTVGLDGQVGPQPSTHGSIRQVGEVLAPLTLSGNGRLGGPLQAHVALFAQDASFLVVTSNWGPSTTPIGPVALDSAVILATYFVSPPWSVQFTVPQSPSFVDMPFAMELLYVQNGTWVVSNAAGTFLAR